MDPTPPRKDNSRGSAIRAADFFNFLNIAAHRLVSATMLRKPLRPQWQVSGSTLPWFAARSEPPVPPLLRAPRAADLASPPPAER